MSEMPSISLPAEPVLDFSWFHINNSVLGTLIVSLIIVIIAVIFRMRISFIPGRFQVFIEMIIDLFMTQLQSAWGGDEAKARKALPFILTIFFFLLIANQFSLIPLVASVVQDGTAVLRTPSSDLSLTVTLAVVMVVGSHIVAFALHPIRHLGNYFKIGGFFKVRSVMDFFSACIDLFLGFLDIIGEIAKMMSMSFRLFGNIFAGEVMGAIITALIAYVAPMPFIVISAFSSVVQAFVFSTLSLNFMAGIILSSQPPAEAKS